MTFQLSQEEGEYLVKLARKAVEERLKNEKIITPTKNTPPKLLQRCGVFVTINSVKGGNKELRGCIGYPYPTTILAQAVIESAINSATQDPRFYPLALEELGNIVFEVSVLTPPEQIKVDNPKKLLSQVKVGKEIDESRQFVPLKIAVLTVSDTREVADDKSGATLIERIRAAGHVLAERSIAKDDVKAIRQRVKAWIDDKFIDVVITTGGTGFTGRDVTPEAVEPLLEKKMDGFATMFLLVSERKIGTSAIQTRATAGVANATYVFCLPGSPGACKDAWDEILVHQLDVRYRPCNFVEILPRLDEHLRRPKAKGATA